MNTHPTFNDALAEAQQRLRHFDELAADLHRRLTAERAGTLPDRSTVVRHLSHYQEQAEQLNAQLRGAKDQSKKRKKEIDAWKLWYNGQADIDKSEAFAKLQQEIDWRAADIAAAEQRISDILQQQLAVEEQVEAAKLTLRVIDEELYRLTVEQDPRWRSLSESRTSARQAMEAMQRSLES